MLYLSAVFFLIALVSGLFGFTGISAGAAVIARICFGIFLLLFLAALVLAVILLM